MLTLKSMFYVSQTETWFGEPCYRVLARGASEWCVGYNAGDPYVVVACAGTVRHVPSNGDWQKAAHGAFIAAGEESPWNEL
jgi:hypothetical protein